MKDLEGFKSKWESKGYVGPLVAAVASIIALVGVSFSVEDLDMITTAIVALATAVGAVGGLIGMYGRKVATKRIK